jgi:hypothetical protein
LTVVYSVDFGPGTLTPDRRNEMTDVTVTNRRADSSANEDLTKLARHGADTFGYKANLRIDRKLAQLLRLRCLRSTTAPTASTSITRPHAAPASPDP